MGFLGGSDGEESACSVGDLSLIPGAGRSPVEENGKSLQYSCLENPMDGGGWWTRATVHRVSKSRTRLSDFTSLVYIKNCKLISDLFSFLKNTIDINANNTDAQKKLNELVSYSDHHLSLFKRTVQTNRENNRMGKTRDT